MTYAAFAGRRALQAPILAGRRQRPGLDLDFTLGVLDPRVSFARASKGWHFDASGVLTEAAVGSPRFDHDPVLLAPRGLLIEEQRTNLLLRSQELDTSPWGTGNCTVGANVGGAPDGSSSAEQITDNATAGEHGIHSGSFVPTLGAAYTFSVFAKAGTLTQLVMRMAGGFPGGRVRFDLSGATATIVNGAPVAAITPIGGGWYRCAITETASGTNGSNCYLRTAVGGAFSYAGTGQSLYVWGAQLEIGASARSYIPTAAAQVTRSADQLSFSVPSGVASLRYTFDDGSTQDVAASPGAYTVPTHLTRRHIKRIRTI